MRILDIGIEENNTRENEREIVRPGFKRYTQAMTCNHA